MTIPYRVYTKEFDEIVRPTDIVDEDELRDLAQNFHRLCPVENFEPLRERLEVLKAPAESSIVSLLVDNSGSMRGAPISFAIGTVGIISMYLDRLERSRQSVYENLFGGYTSFPRRFASSNSRLLEDR